MRLLLSFAALLAACSSPTDDSIETPDSGVEDAGDQPAVVYYRDVKPILDGRCVSCHTNGGIGPIDLSVPEASAASAASIKAQVETGMMPPGTRAKTATPSPTIAR
jgi:mono/diheme cytochrome c family protein